MAQRAAATISYDTLVDVLSFFSRLQLVRGRLEFVSRPFALAIERSVHSIYRCNSLYLELHGNVALLKYQVSDVGEYATGEECASAQLPVFGADSLKHSFIIELSFTTAIIGGGNSGINTHNSGINNGSHNNNVVALTAWPKVIRFSADFLPRKFRCQTIVGNAGKKQEQLVENWRKFLLDSLCWPPAFVSFASVRIHPTGMSLESVNFLAQIVDNLRATHWVQIHVGGGATTMMSSHYSALPSILEFFYCNLVAAKKLDLHYSEVNLPFATAAAPSYNYPYEQIVQWLFSSSSASIMSNEEQQSRRRKWLWLDGANSANEPNGMCLPPVSIGTEPGNVCIFAELYRRIREKFLCENRAPLSVPFTVDCFCHRQKEPAHVGNWQHAEVRNEALKELMTFHNIRNACKCQINCYSVEQFPYKVIYL